MKNIITTAAVIFSIATATAPAMADDRPTSKGPPVTMGDEGKLPASGTVGSKAPEMGATPGTEATGPTTAKGPTKRMGDEGTLPSTGTVSGTVPKMNAPSSTGSSTGQ